MALNSLHDVYIDQLQDIYSACEQSRKVTRELAKAAHDASLTDALERGVDGIERGMETLRGIITAHGADPRAEHCKGMEGLVKEARVHGLNEKFGDKDAQDAMIITQYQRMAHYAIAGYGCCRAFANRTGRSEDVARLETCLEKSHDGDRVMSELAQGKINRAAA